MAMFRDRAEAGRRLAADLLGRDLVDPVILGLPRGGVPVAAEVAGALGAPLDVVMARKLGAPGQPELGVGAVAEGGAQVVDEATVVGLGITDDQLAQTIAAEREELARRVRAYRGGRSLPDLSDRDVVVVDDGLATGVTAEAALLGLRALGAHRLVLAIPVATPAGVRRLVATADQVVCLAAPDELRAVGQWYDDFAQTTDEEVLALLARG